MWSNDETKFNRVFDGLEGAAVSIGTCHSTWRTRTLRSWANDSVETTKSTLVFEWRQRRHNLTNRWRPFRRKLKTLILSAINIHQPRAKGKSSTCQQRMKHILKRWWTIKSVRNNGGYNSNAVSKRKIQSMPLIPTWCCNYGEKLT